jgi:hypothetical protein
VRVLLREGDPTADPLAGSAQLQTRLSMEPSRPAPLEIVLPGDVIVRVYPECEPSMLAHVIGALRGGHC